jgi:general secretion pathway protein H
MKPAYARQSRGFTLIELLVVVVLIGIIATFAVMSISGRAADDRLENEARRIDALLQLAADEAELKGVQLGLHFTVSGYQFVVLNDKHHWAPYAATGPLRARQWPDGMSVDLSVDGHPVAPAPDATAPTGPLAGSATPNAADQTDDPSKDPLQPQVLLLSSGEMTPFALDLKAVGVPLYYHFEGDLLGRIQYVRKDLRS